MDITLYRDDLGQGRRWPVLRGTEIPFDVDGAEIVLVDDVLFTGRTVRAALNAICDLGRPARVRLAVLVDRGHREMPIQPDVVGLHVTTERDERVRVRLAPVDPVDEIVRIAAVVTEPPTRPWPRRSLAVTDRHAWPPSRKAPPLTWNRKHLLGLEELSRDEILAILDTAESFAEISTRSRKKVPALQGRIVFNLFFENSTRTRTSFSLAAKRLSADTQDFSASGSSLSKGESFIDTAKNIEAMGADVMVVRHPTPGHAAPAGAARRALDHQRRRRRPRAPDPGPARPMTIRRAKGRIEGLTVGLVGDISHSRVARSNIWGLTKLGAKVILCGPPTLVPRAWERLGCEVAYHLDEVLPRLRRRQRLRIQFERQQRGLFPSVAEYSQFYMMTQERFELAKDDLLLLAPGPDQPRRRADPGGRRRPALGDPRPGDQRPGRAHGRALPAQRPDRPTRAARQRRLSDPGPAPTRASEHVDGENRVRTIQISGGRIIDPSQDIDQIGDLWISRGRILPLGRGLRGGRDRHRRPRA